MHGPLNPAVDQAAAMVEVNAVLGRLTSGKLKPDTAFELSYALPPHSPGGCALTPRS